MGRRYLLILGTCPTQRNWFSVLASVLVIVGLSNGEVTPVNLKDDAEATVVEPFEKSNVISMIYTYIYIYKCVCGGVRSVMVIVVGNRHCYTSSSLQRDCLHTLPPAIYIYIYIYRERERGSETESEGDWGKKKTENLINTLREIKKPVAVNKHAL